MDISGRTALITGGASGLGAATAHMVYEHGGNVVLADVDDETGPIVATGLGKRALFCKADVTSANPGTAITAVHKGEDLVVFYTSLRGDIFGIAFPEGSGLKEIKDLKGKTIGVSSFASGGTNYIRALLTQAGLKPGVDADIGDPQSIQSSLSTFSTTASTSAIPRMSPSPPTMSTQTAGMASSSSLPPTSPSPITMSRATGTGSASSPPRTSPSLPTASPRTTGWGSAPSCPPPSQSPPTRLRTA